MNIYRLLLARKLNFFMINFLVKISRYFFDYSFIEQFTNVFSLRKHPMHVIKYVFFGWFSITMSIHIGLHFTCDRENVLIGLWRPKASFRPKGPSLDWSRENGWASNKRYRIINLFYPRERHTVYYFQPMWKYRNVEEYTAGYKSVLSLGVQLVWDYQDSSFVHIIKPRVGPDFRFKPLHP